MLTQDPVKIPDIPGKIVIMKKDGKEYIRYVTDRKYNGDKGYTETEGVLIGRRVEAMPTLMYPNERYEEIFGNDEEYEEEEEPPVKERPRSEPGKGYTLEELFGETKKKP